MKRRPIAVAIVLMALLAFAGVLSYVFSPHPIQKGFSKTEVSGNSGSSSPTRTTTSPASKSNDGATQPNQRADQPNEYKPLVKDAQPDWTLLDWSVKKTADRPQAQLRASYYSAPGKFRFIRVEEQIEQDPSGNLKVLTRKEMVGDQIIVKLPTPTTQQKAEELAQQIGAKAAPRPFAPDTWLFNLPPRLDAVPDGMTAAKATGPMVEYTEPNIMVHSLRTPNDPKFNDFTLWHLYNNSQLNKDIYAPKAWDRRTSALWTTNTTTNRVIVAVIDCGVRYTHEDLAGNMWKNPGETGTTQGGRDKATNGRDDDNNGYVDDVYGIDLIDKDSNPMPGTNSGDKHGTRCAGIIGAVGNNGTGTTGVAWGNVQLMALRFISNNNGTIADAITCIDYARTMGAKVINASYGQNTTNLSSESQAIERARTNGVIFVAAAGNNNQSSDTTPFYPAAYTNRNIISVGATDQNDNKASFSNYGATSVDLMAPGVSIYSTEHGTDSSYGTDDGTSFAAPIVSGAVALLIAEYPTETVDQIVARVVNTNAVDVLPSLSGLCVTGGRLNLAKLLPAADVATLPPAVAWHRPDYAEPLINSPMRTPTNLVYSNNLTIFSGLKKFNNTNGVNTYGLVNQTGGWLFYRTSSAVSWSSNALSWHTNNGDYQFWKTTISNVPVRTYQYYLQFDFDSGARTTYAFLTNNADGFSTTTNQATAQASPYTVTVGKATAAITISGTNQTYNGSSRQVSVSTTPSGLSTTVTYNGSSLAPTNVGSYTVVTTINDLNYEGSATNTLTIAKASATVSIGNTSQTYQGTPRSVSVVTTPLGLATVVTYNGISSPPSDPGTYSVLASINDANYQGSATATLVVTGVDNPTGDTNGNGVPNLMEYALLGIDSSSNNANSSAVLTQQSLGSIGSSNTTFSITAVVRTNDPGLTYIPQATLELNTTNWTSSGFITNVANQTNVPVGFQRREYLFNAGTNPRAFLKLTIQQQ